MTENNKHSTEKQKQSAVNRIWMNYFNDYLFREHLISGEDRRKMKLAIEARYGPLPETPTSGKSIL